MRKLLSVLALVGLMLTVLPGAAGAQAPRSRFFPETRYSVSDEGGIAFLSEFERLGGVQAVGYPASRRFQWEGFTVQVFQRVVFQWRPESTSVVFVNVFDRLHELGKDEWLREARQTPPARPFPDAGKSWDQVVQQRLAVMDAHPAIRAKYFSAVGDPVQANGLPVSDVVDMGDALVLRAQRVVLQQWQKDVPWAKAGDVTVALGGDIAKEAGIFPDRAALQPEQPGGAAAPPAEAREYVAWVQDAMAELVTSGRRLQEMGREKPVPSEADLAPNAPYRVRLETEIGSWRRIYAEAQRQTPPPRLAEFHATLLEALKSLDAGAELFLAGIAEGNPAKINAAEPHIQRFVELMDQAALKLQSAPPV